ncbi:protodermal factor 1-like [Andrographis paniculata]|uniref:protodermal factor 1-like n=1 Tax=Andrographis paniculata TaxID=175694 RepID=UPI0021E9287E|nr:protodermal factor 1-like [Andrographis paniculata]
MERKIAVLVALLIQNWIIIPAMAAASFDDQKNFFFPPYPYPGISPPVSYPSPPTHANHGGGGGGGGTQHHPHTPSPPGGGGGSGGGGYHHPPPGTTATPGVVTPPPSPLLPLNPNSPPFTCTYWRNHPTLIWGLMGWWDTMTTAFGVGSLPAAGPGARMNLLQALSNTRKDGFGQLYREGTAALLNSMIDHTKFSYTSSQVRDAFVASLTSEKAAAAQARLFKLANEDGRRS